jgi:outer membrane protein OmpA-like peptidoglycan-associated protein
MMSVSKRLTAGVLAITLLAGCEAWQGQSNTVKGGVYGTAAGAATGAAIGGIVGGGKAAGTGAAIGAVVGLIGGGLIGNYMDRQAKQMQQVLDRQDRLERRGNEIYMSLSSDILFTSGSAALQPGAEDKLKDIAGILQQYPNTIIDIVGHTDSVGSESMNQVLSERRAASVRDVLVSYGVAPNRIITRGAGELRPIASNSTPDGRARNRRVDITIRPDNSLNDQSGGGQAPPYGAEPH